MIIDTKHPDCKDIIILDAKNIKIKRFVISFDTKTKEAIFDAFFDSLENKLPNITKKKMPDWIAINCRTQEILK